MLLVGERAAIEAFARRYQPWNLGFEIVGQAVLHVYHRHTGPEAVAAATEVFLALEARGALVRTRELKEQTLVDTTNVRHITVATPPLRASNPPAALVLPLALAAGLFAGGAAVFAGRVFDRKVRSRDDLERAIGMPVLGRVPRPSAESPLASFEPATPEAKAFRQLLDEIGAASGRTLPRSIGVVSVEPDSGSANVAFNLARAAAALGDRVLLIDASVEQRHLTGAVLAAGAVPRRRHTSTIYGLPLPYYRDDLLFREPRSLRRL